MTELPRSSKCLRGGWCRLGTTVTSLVAATVLVVSLASSSAAQSDPQIAASKPSNGSVDLDSGNGSITATWSFDDNGSAITSYDMWYREYRSTCGPNVPTNPCPLYWIYVQRATATSTTGTVQSLTNGTEYEFRIDATNTHGTTAAPLVRLIAGVPARPSAVTLTSANTELGVSWTAPAANGSAITDYDLQYRACTATDGNSSVLTCATNPTWGTWTAHSHNGTGTTATIGSLYNGTAYQVEVQATNGRGESPWSPPKDATPANVPDAPAAPGLVAKKKSLVASWGAPPANHGTIDDYDVRYRTCSVTDSPSCDASGATWGTWISHSHTGTALSTTISDLTGDTAYQVQVRAHNNSTTNSGNSAWSASATETAIDVPAQPAQPSLTVDNGDLDVSWTTPADNGSAITDYDLQYRACTYSTDLTCSDTATWGSWNSHTHTDAGTTATITGLTNDTAYQVQVQATNSVGDSPWSTSAKAAPAAQKPDKPAAPTLTVDNASLDASWTAPASNGSAITDYDVQYRACTATNGDVTDLACDGTTNTWGTWTSHTHTGAGTTATVTGLTNGTAYQVQVQATNSVGDSPWSNSAKAAPAAQKPSKPATPSLTVYNASLVVSWTAPAANGSAISDYDVQYRACTATDNDVTDLACDGTTNTWGTWTSHTHTGTGITATITGLTNGTAYQVQVQATNSVGDSPWSNSAKAAPAAQKPSKPATPSLTVYNASLVVSWTAPAANGSAISDYDVQYRACTATDNDVTDLACDGTTNTWGTWTSHTHTGTGITATITGLTNGTAYQVQVQATNSVGDSPWSDPAKATPVARPSKPTAPTLTADKASLAVSWTAPTNNGSAITDYDVEYRACTLAADLSCSNSSTATWESLWTSHAHSGTDTAATITGLTNGTAYQVQVRATNGVGSSDWSQAARGTPRVPSPSGPSTAPVGGGAPSSGDRGDRKDLAAPLRYGGIDRYETAALVAGAFVEAHRRASPSVRVSVAILASGEKSPDALAAAPLSRRHNAPVLLTTSAVLHEQVKSFLSSHSRITTVYLLGGPVAISENVESELKALGLEVHRLEGATRYGTAVEIARAAGSAGDWCGTTDATAVLASGTIWQHALVAAPVAYRGRHPILLTPQDALPEAVNAYIAANDIERVVIIGDVDAVSSKVRDDIASAGVEVVRVFGTDAAHTAYRVARAAQRPADNSGTTTGCLGDAQGTITTLGLVTDAKYPDALAAAPLLGLRGAPVMFVSPDAVPQSTLAFIDSSHFEPHDGTAPFIVVGGTAAVPKAHLDRLIRLAAG